MADYFERLNYALGDEDTALEYAILPEQARHVVAVAGKWRAGPAVAGAQTGPPDVR